MIIELILALIVGIIAGTFTGLLPGIHINLVAAILISSLAFFSGIPLIVLACFIVSMSITHTFLDFIPTIYLGAPEEDSFLAALPGHILLQEGKGHEAVVLTLRGSLFALFITPIISILFFIFLSSSEKFISSVIPFALIALSLYSIFREKNILLSLVIFLLSGLLGLLTFNLPVKEPLLPLLSGLFGFSLMITSFSSNPKIKKQKITPLKKINLCYNDKLKARLALIVSGTPCAITPGISSGHAAFMGSEIIKLDNKSFLYLVGGINTLLMGLSSVTVFLIEKSRTGSAVAIQTLLKNMTFEHLLIIGVVSLVSGIISFYQGIFISKYFSKIINLVPYKKISLFAILFLLFINSILTNPLGYLILITSTFLGIFVIHSNVKKINLMGCLIVPVVWFFLLS